MNKREIHEKLFEDLMSLVERPGIKELMAYIRKSDFYVAPASTRFHLSEEGGLLEHSLNVYRCMANRMWVKGDENPETMEKDPFKIIYEYRVNAKVIAEISNESLIIITLLHDICKTNFYDVEMKWRKDSKNQWEQYPAYVVKDKVPYGHGEKSVMMIEEFMKLTPVERYAIRWHMGYTEPKESWNTLGQAIEKFPIIWALHNADQEASHFLEANTGTEAVE